MFPTKWKPLGLASLASLTILLAGIAPAVEAAPATVQPIHPITGAQPGHTGPLSATVQDTRASGNSSFRSCAGCPPLTAKNLKPAPPGPYNVPPSAAMSVTLPQADGTDNTQIQDFTSGDVVRVPWPEVEFQFPIAYNDTGSGFDADTASFYVGVELCLTPDQAASYPNEVSGQFLGAPSPDGCSQQPICPLTACGNWYLVMANSGSIARPYAVNEVLAGPDYVNRGTNYRQAPSGGQVNDVLTIYWDLPYRFNTMRFDLTADTAGGSGPSQDRLTTGPVTVGVVPTALMQLKVLPYTILYAAAGDKSSTTYTSSTEFATSMSVGNNIQIDNTWSEKSSVDAGSNISLSLGPFGFDLGGDTTWDHSTRGGTGVATSTATTFERSDKKEFSLGSPPVGDQSTFDAEPFWSDEIVLMLHPQLAIWDIRGKAKVQSLGALGDPALPSFARPTVRQLDECAHGKPMVPAEQVLADNNIFLTADECSALLSLDPFYPGGQRFGGADSSRTQFVTEQEYGNVHGTYGLSDEQQASLQVTTERSSTYSATVEDVRTTSATAGLTFTMKDSVSDGSGGPCVDLGLSSKISNTQGGGTTSSTQMQISYKQSNAVKETQAIKVAGQLDAAKADFDVHIYYDNSFGTFMYVYLNAPCKQFNSCAVPVFNDGSTNSSRIALGGVSAITTKSAGALAAPHPLPIKP